MKQVFRRFLSIITATIILMSAFPLKVSADSPALTASAEPAVSSPLIITAANFDNDTTKNPLGEFIELKNTTEKTFELINTVIKYKGDAIISFPKNSFVPADSYVVLKNGDQFKTNLSMEAGNLTIEINGLEVDRIEWDKSMNMHGTKENRSATLIKCRETECESTYSFDKEYTLHENSYFETEPEEETVAGEGSEENSEGPLTETTLTTPEIIECEGLLLNEIYSYYENEAAEQFIEIYNPTEDIIELKSCQIWIKYSGKYQKYTFETETIEPQNYFTFYPSAHDLKLAKDPSGAETILLLDDNPDYVIDASITLSGQKKAWSFALIEDTWQKTMLRTPNAPNVSQLCPAGKITNPATGKCIGITEEEPLPDCGAGKFRNPETNRCKSYDVLSTALAPCNEGYYRNELTNRCNKIATPTELKPCEEGYERNPETNRCRKIRENNGADYAVEPLTYADKATFAAWGAAGSTAALGTGYTLLQFRAEIRRFFKKLFRFKK